MAHRFNNFRPKQKQREGPISVIQIDGLVVLRIIKHAQEEIQSKAEVQGVLLGMVDDSQLEVTNCFPFPKLEDETAEMDYQYKMLKHFRNANVDHLLVGWYQINSYGSSLNKLETVDSQFHYQDTIPESIVLLYDPVRTQKGYLALKAYRLTNAAMKLKKDNQFTVEALKSNDMSFTKFWEEIPVKIRNSQLIKSLMFELDDKLPVDEGKQLLDLGTMNNLEKSLQSLMKNVDKLAVTQKHHILKQQQIQKENVLRAARGEAPLSEEEVNKILKITSPDDRLENILNFSQTLNYCNQTAQYSTQNITKLYMNKSLEN